MMTIEEIYQLFRKKKVKYSTHCYHRLLERNISQKEIISAVKDGKIIETTIEKRYSKYLICGKANGKYIHVVLKVSDGNLVITVYYPYPELWNEDFTIRIKEGDEPDEML